jgi:uncharacterized OB-fold protein
VPPMSPPTPLPDLEALDAPMVLREGAEARLSGCRCEGCGAVHFPSRLICFECTSDRLVPHALGPGGTLYGWTTVRVSSSRPVPYAIGYVDLPDGVRVLADLTGDPEALRHDGPVRLVVDAAGEWSFTAEVEA